MVCDYQALPHPGIQTLSPYVPGKSIESLAKEQGLTDIIKLASNENPLGPSPEAIHALSKLTPADIAAYPQTADTPLRQKLADKLSIKPGMLTFGNGSDALFPLAMICFALHRNKSILIHEKAFIAYRIYANTLGIPVINTPIQKTGAIDLKAMLKACHKQTALIFLANPNNPTGILTASDDIKQLLANIPDSTILVLDEAYFEYIDSDAYQNSIALLQQHKNLIITRTFSKAYGLAGLRLGYAVAHEEISAILNKASPPFDINKAALVAANAALDDDAFIQKTRRITQTGRQWLQAEFDDMGLSYLPGAGNFITINCQKEAGDIYKALLQQGIIVRPLHPYGLNDWLRVTIGTNQQNERFMKAFKAALKG